MPPLSAILQQAVDYDVLLMLEKQPSLQSQNQLRVWYGPGAITPIVPGNDMTKPQYETSLQQDHRCRNHSQEVIEESF
jgi:hypothetical protein